MRRRLALLPSGQGEGRAASEEESHSEDEGQSCSGAEASSRSLPLSLRRPVACVRRTKTLPPTCVSLSLCPASLVSFNKPAAANPCAHASLCYTSRVARIPRVTVWLFSLHDVVNDAQKRVRLSSREDRSVKGTRPQLDRGIPHLEKQAKQANIEQQQRPE